MVPKNFIIDRCYVHGWPGTPAQPADMLHGIRLNCVNATVEHSYISEIHSTSQEAMAICGANGIGPFLITDNYLEAAAENVFFGGGDSHVDLVRDGQGNVIGGADASYITITHNYFSKPLSWDAYLNDGYIGVQYVIKNDLDSSTPRSSRSTRICSTTSGTPAGRRAR